LLHGVPAVVIVRRTLFEYGWTLAMILRMRWPWRFNLRSLPVATTFLAIVLGMIAWLDRSCITTPSS
jgi:hypothetical protein